MSVTVFDPSSLNPEQKDAVMHASGPLMIIAGAGSGKTRVITCRIARLIEEGVAPWRILAVTFTNKASREMKERVVEMVGDRAQKMMIGTFHSTFARILRIGRARGVNHTALIVNLYEATGTAFAWHCRVRGVILRMLKTSEHVPVPESQEGVRVAVAAQVGEKSCDFRVHRVPHIENECSSRHMVIGKEQSACRHRVLGVMYLPGLLISDRDSHQMTIGR